ncbi:MAG: EF-hand domain-containing protein [Planctomycetota bacterium]
MSLRFVHLLTLAGVIFVPNLLQAQPPGRGGPRDERQDAPPPPPALLMQLFSQADADNDGSVTKAEWQTMIDNQVRDDRRGTGGPPHQERGERLVGRRGPGGPPERGPGRRDVDGPEGRGQQARPDHPRGPRGQDRPNRPGGPPPRPGQVLPDDVAESLNMTAEQAEQLAKLQAEVDERLAKILTEEQKQQMEDHHRRSPRHEDGPPRDRPEPRGDRDRPQRPR